MALQRGSHGQASWAKAAPSRPSERPASVEHGGRQEHHPSQTRERTHSLSRPQAAPGGFAFRFRSRKADDRWRRTRLQRPRTQEQAHSIHRDSRRNKVHPTAAGTRSTHTQRRPWTQTRRATQAGPRGGGPCDGSGSADPSAAHWSSPWSWTAWRVYCLWFYWGLASGSESAAAMHGAEDRKGEGDTPRERESTTLNSPAPPQPAATRLDRPSPPSPPAGNKTIRDAAASCARSLALSSAAARLRRVGGPKPGGEGGRAAGGRTRERVGQGRRIWEYIRTLSHAGSRRSNRQRRVEAGRTQPAGWARSGAGGGLGPRRTGADAVEISFFFSFLFFSFLLPLPSAALPCPVWPSLARARPLVYAGEGGRAKSPDRTIWGMHGTRARGCVPLPEGRDASSGGCRTGQTRVEQTRVSRVRSAGLSSPESIWQTAS